MCNLCLKSEHKIFQVIQNNLSKYYYDIYVDFRDEQKLCQKQLAYVLGRLQIFLELDEESEDVEDLAEIISNSHLNNSFLALAREVLILFVLYSLFHCFFFSVGCWLYFSLPLSKNL